MQQQQRLAATMNLVVVVDTLGENVAFLRGRSLRRGGGIALYTLRAAARRSRHHGDARQGDGKCGSSNARHLSVSPGEVTGVTSSPLPETSNETAQNRHHANVRRTHRLSGPTGP